MKRSTSDSLKNESRHQPPLKSSNGSKKKTIIIWSLISIIVFIGIYLNLDKFLIANIAILMTVASQAISGLATLVSTVPIVGPFLIKILSLPIIWVINGLGYLASLIALKRGYSKDVLTYRALAIATIAGIIIGYILGKYI